MPHTTKKEYQRIKETPKCGPNTEVFYLPSTKEIFTEYDEYFERILQLFSSVWICSISGRSGFTYDEALESEKEALKQINSFPKSLRTPILYIVYKFSHRATIDDLVNDVLSFIKDRYFLNEVVKFRQYKGKETRAKILSIDYKKSSNPATLEENSDAVFSSPDSFEYTLQILENDPDSSADSDSNLEISGIRGGIKHSKLRRGIAIATRPKLKLFIKYNTEVNVDHLIMKNQSLHRYGLEKLHWEDIFAGPLPKFPRTQRHKKSKTSEAGLNESSNSRPKETSSKLERKDKNSESASAAKKRADNKAEIKKKKEIAAQQTSLTQLFQAAEKFGVDNLQRWRQENVLLTDVNIEQLHAAITAAKENEKQKQLDKRRREREELIEWKKPRDDLLCDDLKPLPSYEELIWPEWIPRCHYMDLISIHNFLAGFYDVFPKHQQTNLWEVVMAVVTRKQDSSSHYYRLLRYLVETVGTCIEEDEGDEVDIDNPEEVGTEQNKDIDHPVHGSRIRQINKEHALIRDTHGISLRHLKVDPLNLTEFVRLTLTTSGFYSGNRRANRGGMRCYEDDFYIFVGQHPEIMEILEKESVYDLNCQQRILLITTFINQILSYARFRSSVEQRIERLNELRKTVRQLQQNDYQYERDSRIALAAKLAKSGEVEAVQQPTETRRPSKELLNLKRFLQTYNEGRRIVNIQEMKKVFIEESLPWDEMIDEEITEFRAVQKEFFVEETNQMLGEIYKLNTLMSNCFLGRDRAFRSYYFFHYFSIFVIQPPQETGSDSFTCDESTPIDKVDISSLKNTGEFTSSSSTDETPKNVSDTTPPENKDKFDKNTIISYVSGCSSEQKNCFVHKSDSSKLYFYVEEDGIEKLLNSLNPRGFREIELADNINSLKDYYAQALNKMGKMSQKCINSNLSTKFFGLNNPLKETLSNDVHDDCKNYTLVIEQILELEQRINERKLGILQATVDRVTWRNALKDTGDTSTLCEENVLYLQNSLADEMLYDSEDLDPEAKKLSPITKLGIALLQVFQGIRLECLKDPFVGKAKDKTILPTHIYINWQKGLVRCRSPSSISLFLSSFSRFINWNFTTPLSHCAVCDKKVYDTEKPIFCAECGDVYHSKCLNLRYYSASDFSNWHCPHCHTDESKSSKSKSKSGTPIGDELNNGVTDNRNDGRRAQKKRLDYSPTPSSSSSGMANRSTEHRNSSDDTNMENHEYIEQMETSSSSGLLLPSTRKRKPVRKYGEFAFNDELGDESADSLCEFFSRRSYNDNVGPKRKKEAVEHDKVHIRSITMGLREAGVGRNKKELIRLWEGAIADARKQPFSAHFVDLVDRKQYPHYYEIIKEPLSLRSIIQKIKAYEYNSTDEVWADCELIFKNCQTFNQEGSPILVQCQQLREFLQTRFAAI